MTWMDQDQREAYQHNERSNSASGLDSVYLQRREHEMHAGGVPPMLVVCPAIMRTSAATTCWKCSPIRSAAVNKCAPMQCSMCRTHPLRNVAHRTLSGLEPRTSPVCILTTTRKTHPRTWEKGHISHGANTRVEYVLVRTSTAVSE